MRDLEATRLLHAMLRIKSSAGQESRAARFLVRELSHHGLEAEVDPSGKAIASAGSGPATLALISRLDTRSSAGAVRLEGDLLHGPGAVCGKGPLAAFAAAMVRFTKERPEGLRVLLIGSVDEPRYSESSFAIAQRYRPDYVLVGEASGWNSYAGLSESAPEAGLPDAKLNSQLAPLPSNARLRAALEGAIRARREGAPHPMKASGPHSLYGPLLPQLRRIWDCPTLAYGAGDVSLAGTAGERVRLGSFTRSVAVLTDVMHALAKDSLSQGRTAEPATAGCSLPA